MLMQVAMEFDMIMHTESSRENFEKSWMLWGHAVMEYAKAMRSPPSSLKKTLQDMALDDDGMCMCIIYTHCKKWGVKIVRK